MKIKKLYINDYKMFKDFDISFVDKDDNPFNIIILAGVNGSGKTTLLEYMYNFIEYLDNQRLPIDDFIEVSLQKEPKGLGSLDSNNYPLPFECHKIENNNFKEYMNRYKQNIIYLPIYESPIENIKNSILIYYRIISRELDSHTKALKKIQNIIDTLFEGMDINLTIDDVNDIDKNDEKVIFKNKNGDNFKIENLSTGQKTLLSKILYFYFRDVRNQVILIDEPELSLHPKWQNQILKLYDNFAKANECQIIIATHSPHIIGSAKNEWIRILTEDGVINSTLAYGRDINWVLREMGLENTRPPKILKKIEECKEFLEEDNYDEAEKCIDEIEGIIGNNDREVLALRNSLEFWRE
jgi:predicted ATP-binding protein involved in virulence